MDCAEFKLGKREASPIGRHRLRLLSDYTHEDLPEPPESADWSAGRAYWGMMQNDRLGNCTAASAAHAIQVWTQTASGAAFTPPDQDIVDFYAQSTGYAPGDMASDQGGIAADVLKYWSANSLSGHKIDAVARLHDGNAHTVPQPSDSVEMQARLRDSIWLTGGAYLGMELPATCQRQAIWTAPADPSQLTGNASPGSWGGHCVYACAYSPAGVTCITWGILKLMTWEFLAAYCSESFALLSKDWITSASGKSPAGFDWQSLINDMSALAD
jgi:hypothetical protein